MTCYRRCMGRCQGEVRVSVYGVWDETWPEGIFVDVVCIMGLSWDVRDGVMMEGDVRSRAREM